MNQNFSGGRLKSTPVTGVWPKIFLKRIDAKKRKAPLIPLKGIKTVKQYVRFERNGVEDSVEFASNAHRFLERLPRDISIYTGLMVQKCD